MVSVEVVLQRILENTPKQDSVYRLDNADQDPATAELIRGAAEQTFDEAKYKLGPETIAHLQQTEFEEIGSWSPSERFKGPWIRSAKIREVYLAYLIACEDKTNRNTLENLLAREIERLTWYDAQGNVDSGCVAPSFFTWYADKHPQGFKALLTSRLQTLSELTTAYSNERTDKPVRHGVRYDDNLAGIAYLATVTGEADVTERISTVARSLHESKSLTTESRNRIRRVIHYFDREAGSSVLYEGKSESFFDSDSEKPLRDDEWQAVSKDHNELFAVGGKAVGDRIIRTISGTSLRAWLTCLQSGTWSEIGFDYIPVEPIEREDGEFRIHTSKQAVKQDKNRVRKQDISASTEYYVVTQILGPSFREVFDQSGRSELPDPYHRKEELENMYERLQAGLDRIGVRHGHLHWGNICMQRDSNDDLRVYIIDFDIAELTD